jgi:hypothetical protein
MSEVFILIVANKTDIECCEAFDNQKLAADTALSIAKIKCKDHLDWINEKPVKESIVDGFKWNFLNTSHRTIMVFSRTITPTMVVDKPVASTPFAFVDGYHSPSPIRLLFDNVLGDTFLKHFAQQSPVVDIVKDDPADRNLPAGWDYNNKPILMSDLIDNPSNVKPYSELSENQLKALVIARIKKRPHYSLLMPGYGTFIQSSALIELEHKSIISDFIIDEEIDWLIDFIDE